MKRLVTLLCLALAAASAWSQDDANWFWGKPIAGVQWEGIAHADSRELDTVTKRYIGEAFTQELWLELQAKLYELDWFENISPAAIAADPERSKIILKFTVAEKPSIESIRVVGNSGLRASEILDAITEKAEDIYNPPKARIDELAVRRVYLEKGFPDAVVSSSVAPGRESGRVVLSFTIIEGAQVAVKAIGFSGNAAVSSQTLKGQISLKEKSLFQDGAFQEAKLEEDKRSIVDYYRSRGFIDAAVSDVIRSYEKDPKSGRTWLVLTFAITEGLQWTYGGITFEGNAIFSDEKLNSLVYQKAGGTLNYKKLQQDKMRIDDLYYESGYIFNSIELVEKRDLEAGIISYVVKIAEYDRAHIESIEFKGNDKTRDYVLFREFPLEVGDIFSKAKVMDGLRNLYNLQYFSAVEPEMFPGSGDNLMQLVINVEEQSTADIQFGITLSGFGEPDTFPFSGLVKWNDRNFLGRGQNFGVELNASPTDQTLSFNFADNWLFGERFSGSVNLAFAHKTKTTGQDSIGPIFDDGVPDPFTAPKEEGYSLSEIPAAYLMPYEYWDFSLGFTAGRSFRTALGDVGFSGGYTIDLGMKTFDAEKYRPASKELRENRDRWLLSNKVPLRLYLNKLDLWYNPTNGYYASQRLSWAGFLPGEPQQYIKTETRIDGYLTLFDIPVLENWNFTWILGGHSGFSALVAKPWSGGLVVTDDWLGIDGIFNARGWNGLYGKEGIGLWENWVELRMPIIAGFLWIDGFFDAAVLQTQGGLLDMTAASPAADPSRPGFGDLGWESWAFSLGFGLRFAIPQFPFRFYFTERFTFDGSEIDWKTSKPEFVISITQPLF